MKNAQQQQAIITRECKECRKSFRAFSDSNMEFCSYECAEAYQFMLDLDEHCNNKNTKNIGDNMKNNETTKRILRKLTMAGQEITIYADAENRISTEITKLATTVERTIQLDNGQRIIVSLNTETMSVRAGVWSAPVFKNWIKGVKPAREIAGIHYAHLTSQDFFASHDQAKAAGANDDILAILQEQAEKLQIADLRGLASYYEDFLLDHVTMEDFQEFFCEPGNAIDFVESLRN